MAIPRPDRALPNWLRYTLLASVLVFSAIFPQLFNEILGWVIISILVGVVVVGKLAVTVGLSAIGPLSYLNRFGLVSLPNWFEALKLATLPIRIATGAIGTVVEELIDFLPR